MYIYREFSKLDICKDTWRFPVKTVLLRGVLKSSRHNPILNVILSMKFNVRKIFVRVFYNYILDWTIWKRKCGIFSFWTLGCQCVPVPAEEKMSSVYYSKYDYNSTLKKCDKLQILRAKMQHGLGGLQPYQFKNCWS